MDALIGALDQLIAKKRDLKQAAMQQLLTGQTRLPGFSGEWEVKRLGDVALEIVMGQSPTFFEVTTQPERDIPSRFRANADIDNRTDLLNESFTTQITKRGNEWRHPDVRYRAPDW